MLHKTVIANTMVAVLSSFSRVCIVTSSRPNFWNDLINEWNWLVPSPSADRAVLVASGDYLYSSSVN